MPVPVVQILPPWPVSVDQRDVLGSRNFPPFNSSEPLQAASSTPPAAVKNINNEEALSVLIWKELQNILENGIKQDREQGG